MCSASASGATHVLGLSLGPCPVLIPRWFFPSPKTREGGGGAPLPPSQNPHRNLSDSKGKAWGFHPQLLPEGIVTRSYVFSPQIAFYLDSSLDPNPMAISF